MFEKRRRAPDPDADLQPIEAWAKWFIGAHEEMLRSDPDVKFHAAKRAQVKAIADARVAEVRALLARRQP